MNQEAASNLGVFALTVLFAALGWINDHTMMRHGLFAAATWSGGALTARLFRESGYATVEQVRLFNGTFAWVVVLTLIAVWVTQWVIERRFR